MLASRVVCCTRIGVLPTRIGNGSCHPFARAKRAKRSASSLLRSSSGSRRGHPANSAAPLRRSGAAVSYELCAGGRRLPEGNAARGCQGNFSAAHLDLAGTLRGDEGAVTAGIAQDECCPTLDDRAMSSRGTSCLHHHVACFVAPDGHRVALAPAHHFSRAIAHLQDSARFYLGFARRGDLPDRIPPG